jgi:penicillin-binding protein 2
MRRARVDARRRGLTRLAVVHRRLWLLRVIVILLLTVLVSRLWDLQVLASDHYRSLARADFVRDVAIPATRGRILDRTGKLVVGNQASWSVLVDPSQLGSRGNAVLDRLASLLGVPRSRIDERLRIFTSSPFAIPVASNVQPKVLFDLAEHADQFPGVTTEPAAVRSYPYGSAAAQVLGYVGPVTADELNAPAYRGALPGDDVGQAGVEQAYDQVLRGRDGLERLEVDAQGRVVRVLSVTPPVAGENLRLTIDIGLQRQLDADLARQIARLQHAVDPRTGRPYPAPSGAAVVLDPHDGSVLAMSSYPNYDPSVWVGGVSQTTYRHLTAASAHQPLLNRAISGLYAPGSTFKLVTATAALDDGLINPSTTIDDTGTFTIPGCVGQCSFHNDSKEALGPLDVSRALSASDDVFFYHLGDDFWTQRGRYGPEPIQQMAARYGLGRATGVALPGESAGRVDSPTVRQALHRQAPAAFPNSGWYPGDNLELAFGQGGTIVTPLQLAGAYATLANGGTRYRPRIAADAGVQAGRPLTSYAPTVAAHVPLPAGVRDPILQGLVGAVRQPGGTATTTFQGFPFGMLSVAGKTGTASATDREPAAWFACFAPTSGTRYAMAVSIDQAGYGAAAAAPVARQALEYLASHPIASVQSPSSPAGTG